MRSPPGHVQEAVRRHPRGTREAPRRPRGHPGGTQEAPRRHPGGTQEAPRDPRPPRRLPERPKLDLEGKCSKPIEFFCQKRRNRPLGADETSPTLTKSGKYQQTLAGACRGRVGQHFVGPSLNTTPLEPLIASSVWGK